MNTLKISILLLAAIALFSCQKDEDVKPATNPRFSVAYVQNIDASGVEFAANMFEFGSEEILEYGFVYDRQINPSIEKSNVVKASGKPNQTFELKATTPLAKDQIIYVAAFIRTNQKTVYSEQIEFKSQGSGSFFVENFDYKPEIYFGDTVIVTGNNFGKDLANIKVYVDNQVTLLHDLTANTFKFVFPIAAGNSFVSKQAELPVRIEIGGQSKEFRKLFSLMDPIVRQPSLIKANYRDQITIEGEYLFGGKLLVSYDGGTGVELLANPNDLRIPGFAPSIISRSPNISISVRGKTFELGKIFELNPTELLPGQEFILDPFKIEWLKGVNFHPATSGNKLIAADGREFPVIKTSQNADGLNMYFPASEVYPNRKKELFIENFGMVSKNSFTIINRQPYAYILEDQSIPWAGDYQTVSLSEAGLLIGGGRIYKIDFKNGFFTTLEATIPANKRDYSFMVTIGEDIYFGAATDGFTDSRNFFKYNMATRTFSDLPALPPRMGIPRRIYEIDGKIVFEAGFYSLDNEDRGFSPERHRYNPVSATWEKIDEKSSTNHAIINGKVFEHDGNTYSLEFNYEESTISVRVLDKSDLNWNLLFKSNYAEIDTKSIYKLNGNILLKAYNQFKVIDFENKKFNDYPIVSSHQLFPYFFNGLKFYYNDKIYSYSSGLLEFDPAYNY
jgi:hypothetical protein